MSLRFRGQMLWQNVLPQHLATKSQRHLNEILNEAETGPHVLYQSFCKWSAIMVERHLNIFLNQGYFIVLAAASSHSDGFEQHN